MMQMGLYEELMVTMCLSKESCAELYKFFSL